MSNLHRFIAFCVCCDDASGFDRSLEAKQTNIYAHCIRKLILQCTENVFRQHNLLKPSVTLCCWPVLNGDSGGSSPGRKCAITQLITSFCVIDLQIRSYWGSLPGSLPVLVSLPESSSFSQWKSSGTDKPHHEKYIYAFVRATGVKQICLCIPGM